MMADKTSQPSMGVHAAPELQHVREHLARQGVSHALDLLPNVSESPFHEHNDVFIPRILVPFRHKLQVSLKVETERSASTFVCMALFPGRPPLFNFLTEKLPSSQDRHSRTEYTTALGNHASALFTLDMRYPFDVFNTGSKEDLQKLKALVIFYFLWSGHATFQEMKHADISSFFDDIASAVKRLRTLDQERAAREQDERTLENNVAGGSTIIAAPRATPSNAVAEHGSTTIATPQHTSEVDAGAPSNQAQPPSERSSLCGGFKGFLAEIEGAYSLESPDASLVPLDGQMTVTEQDDDIRQRYEKYTKALAEHSQIDTILARLDWYKKGLERRQRDIRTALDKDVSGGDLILFEAEKRRGQM